MNPAGAFDLAAGTMESVLVALTPLMMLFLVFQVLFLRLPQEEVKRVLAGTLAAGAGLFLFLLGVEMAFVPFGRLIGEALVSLPHDWMLVPLGLLLGFVTTWGEPAVRILAHEVEESSGGSIPRTTVVITVCAGVALAVAVGMLRINHDIPLLYLLVPGYGLVLAIMWLADSRFVAIAVDSGGVATGPLANSFLLALALGASSAMGNRDPIVQGFGLVALIALAPVLSLMVLGLSVRWK